MFARSPHNERVSIYTPAILLLIAIVGVSFLGLGLVMPIRSLYGREVGASSVEIGLMTSSFLLAAFIATPFVGWLSDRFGHGNVLWIGLLCHAALMLAYIPIQNPVLLIILRALEGIASASVLPPTRALVNILAPKTRQGEALGLMSAAQMVGILIGPVVGSFLASIAGYTPSFVLATLPLALAALATLIFLPKRGEVEPRTETDSPRVSTRGLFTRELTFVYVLQIAIMFAAGVVMSIWTIYMLDRGSSLPLIGLSFTTFAIPIIFIAPFIGRISDKYGRYWPIFVGLLLYGIAFCLYALPLTPWWIVIISAFEAIGATIVRSPVDGLLADVTPAGVRGRVQANYSAAGSLGNFVGATVAGFLYSISPGAPFLLEGLFCLVLAAALLLPPIVRIFPGRPHQHVAETRVAAEVLSTEAEGTLIP